MKINKFKKTQIQKKNWAILRIGINFIKRILLEMETKHNLDRLRKWWGGGSNHKQKSKSTYVQGVLGDHWLAGFLSHKDWSRAVLEDRYFVESLTNLNKIIGMNSREEPLRVFKIEIMEW